MKRYLIGSLLAYGAAVFVFVGVLLVSLSNWLFSDSPLWFDVLAVLMEVLPMLALGELAGRRAKHIPSREIVPGFVFLLCVMLGMAVMQEQMMETSILVLVAGPCALMGGMLQALAELLNLGGGYWESLFLLFGPLLLPVTYHIGWHWGQTD